MLSKSIITGKHYWQGEEITETEYNRILAIIRNCPTAPDGCAYRLTENLEWELLELSVEETDPELTESEALNIILGGMADA